MKQVDRIGEKVDLARCPACPNHSDCFGWLQGKCTVLSEYDCGDCVFYCPNNAAIEAARKAYQRLRDLGRHDLIYKYVKQLTALGMLDDEINDFDQDGQDLAAFEADDLARLMSEAPGFYR